MAEYDLRVRTKRFALEVIRFVRDLPTDMVSQTIGRQLIRCGTSVGANYRSARLAKSDADMVAKLKLVEEEADECIYWLELLGESKTVPVETTEPLTREAGELFRIAAASAKTVRERALTRP